MTEKRDIEFIHKIIDEMILVRKTKGLSHQTLADLAGLNRSAISLIESKKRVPSILNVLKICNALGIKLSILISNAETQNKI
jgi:transcriptional regulator with XRE-family HTH domain